MGNKKYDQEVKIGNMIHAPKTYLVCIGKRCHENKLETFFFILQAPKIRKTQLMIKLKKAHYVDT